ncbi:hypothetical protein EDC04DRAFT_1081053 [Pisolithus marmoratus]|nr:hypothetical protein EDC04DRAFT_1081053 [Pisolithus marmoratus]
MNSRWVGEEVGNFQTVLNMCGEEAVDRLRLVSTMWHVVDVGCGIKVQEELENLVGKVPKTGARCEKFDNTATSAWAIVEGLGDERKVLSVQKKMVDNTVDPQIMSGCKWIADLLSM